MSITGLSQVIKFWNRPILDQGGHREATLFEGQNDCYRTHQPANRLSDRMSKNIIQLKSLHQHAIAVKSTPVNGKFHQLLRFL